MPRPEPEQTYDYRDEDGKLLCQVVRFPGKQFRQRKPDGSGGWVWKLDGVRRVLYRLQELLAKPEETVYFVEGEKDVETMRSHGFLATTLLGGSCAWRQTREHAITILGKRHVIVISDADEPGRRLARQVCEALGCEAFEPTKGKDITDHLAQGGTVADCTPLQAPRIAPVPDVSEVAPVWAEEEAATPDDDGRPLVRMGNDVHRVIAELDQALGERDPLLFQRDNEVVGIAGSRAKEGKARLQAGTPIIVALKPQSLLPRVSEHVHCVRLVKPAQKAARLALVGGDEPPKPQYQDAMPTPTILGAFLGALDWLHVRPIAGITECPALRPDGTVMQEAGYDEQTGYLYLPTLQYPRIDDNPTHSDAVTACNRLAEVFCDFPYVDPSHRSAVLASILAIVARPSIEGSVPCFLFDASSRRSGKTLQVDVVSLITSGRFASRMTYPVEDEELEKVLAGYALMGARMVNFDNIEGPFGGPALDKCITAVDTVDLRVLGTSTMRTVTWRSVIFASGNNVRGRGDILERVLAPRVESPLEHPEKRDPSTLRHPFLRQWAREHRGELVQYALTILRAFCASGRPRQSGVEPWGGFEPFTDLVVHALVWAGAPDPLGARRGGDDEYDPTRAAERAVVLGWSRLCSEHAAASLTLSGGLKLIYPAPGKDEPPDGYDGLREAFSELANAPGGFPPGTKRLGDVFRRLKNKPTDGLMLTPDGEVGGVTRWKSAKSKY